MTAPAKTPISPDFRVLFESAPDLYLVLTPDLDIVAASDAYLNATMTKREEILGRSLFEVFPDNPEDPNATGIRNLKASLDRVLQNQVRDTMPLQKYDVCRPQANGGGFEERHWIPINSPVFGEDQRLIYIIHRVEDVSEFVCFKQLAGKERRIAKEFRMRAEQMETEPYSHADQLAEANRQRWEALDRLAGGVAHDFNNLLGVIVGYAKVLKEGIPESGSFQRGIEQIEQAAQNAATLTRQLLAFSQQQVFELKVLDLNTAVSGIEPLIRQLISDNIECQTILSPQLGRVKADRGQIEQVIMNLAINARDAMPGGGKLMIETSNVEVGEAYVKQHPMVVPGPYVVLSVADTGSGINQEIQTHIFEPFFTTKERGKGAGLGLATVYGIVKQSGGYVWVYSEPGIGTAFKVYLPRTEEVLDPAVAAHGNRTAGGSETILLVEDQAMLRELAQTMLEQDGYAVLTAEESTQALDIARTYPGTIDLLITDVILPGMNGQVLAEHFGKARRGVKVLFVSGYAESIIANHGKLNSGAGFLGKPFTRDELRSKVREILNQPDEIERVGLSASEGDAVLGSATSEAERKPS